RIEQKSHVVKLQILHPFAPQLKKLLPHHIDVSDYDGIDGLPGRSPFDSRRYDVTLLTRFVRKIRCKLYSEKGGLNQTRRAGDTRLFGSLKQRCERRLVGGGLE